MTDVDVVTDLDVLLDRAALHDQVSRLAYAEDDKDYDAFRALFADTVYVDMRTLHGGEAQEISADELTERARRALDGFEYTQHSAANVLVTLDGDRAQVRANVTAYHHVPTEPGVDDYCTVRVYWNLGFVRTSGSSWLIDRVVVVRDGPIQGYFGVYRIAAERAAARGQ
jgi:3-phenylpropionate/cinnamic acid dioxygenase small subunit